jgi:hypothetical protein
MYVFSEKLMVQGRRVSTYLSNVLPDNSEQRENADGAIS